MVGKSFAANYVIPHSIVSPASSPIAAIHFNQFDISFLTPLPCRWILLIKDAPLEHPSLLLCLVTKALLKMSMPMLRSSLRASYTGHSGGGEGKGRRAVRLWNFNICIKKVDAKCWLAEMTLVMMSLPLAYAFMCFSMFFYIILCLL